MNTLYIYIYIYMCVCVFDCHGTTCSMQFNIGQKKKNSEKQKQNHKLIITRSIEKKNRYIIMSNFCVIDDISANLPDLVT